MPSKKVTMSSYYDGAPPNSFFWTYELITTFSYRHYRITLLLHGQNLKYASAVDNPYKRLLKYFHRHGVKIVVCDLCESALPTVLLPFVKPVPFSIDFIIQQQEKYNAVTIYDAFKPTPSSNQSLIPSSQFPKILQPENIKPTSTTTASHNTNSTTSDDKE